jgi:hypothetical protein
MQARQDKWRTRRRHDIGDHKPRTGMHVDHTTTLIEGTARVAVPRSSPLP